MAFDYDGAVCQRLHNTFGVLPIVTTVSKRLPSNTFIPFFKEDRTDQKCHQHFTVYTLYHLECVIIMGYSSRESDPIFNSNTAQRKSGR